MMKSSNRAKMTSSVLPGKAGSEQPRYPRRFAEIDRERIRPLAAIVAGVGTDEDKSRLKALEEEAAQLRAVLADMEDKDENN